MVVIDELPEDDEDEAFEQFLRARAEAEAAAAAAGATTEAAADSIDSDGEDDSDAVFEPETQRAAELQKGSAAEPLREVMRWYEAEQRREREDKAEKEGGFFDFEDLPVPEAPKVDPREPLTVPEGMDKQEQIRFAEKAFQKAIAQKAVPKTARQQIKDALEDELKTVPLGDSRRRKLKVKAAKEISLAPEDPPPTRHEARELGTMLCTMQEARGAPRRGVDGQWLQPGKPRPLDEREAIEILKRHADPNMRVGDLKRYPLHKAAEVGYPNLIRELLKAAADPNRADFAGEIPLHTAAHSGGWCKALPSERIRAIENLVEGRADINFANPRGRTALHIASSAGDLTMIKAFLAENADVNAADLGGFTPLMWAAGHGRVNEIQALLDAAADATLQANRGQTAKLFAVTNSHEKVAELLDAHQLVLVDKEQKRLELQDYRAKEAAARGVSSAVEEDEETVANALAKPYKYPKQTLHFPYMGRVREDYVPDMSSNVY
eukprot:gnl/TRDRNA2_/TRDRNA2_190065_c0_seq1.p1 gnl/TRDRNA2_/TRDRNA2_190065_c0~~gnl/TRDRNA2_/TRDRNA2_190065_c0_seq1.p1  ORF type:complete len:494 (+),score=147.20 gnl/TRDRNA2_/TRDRNA2_190065_c0_seq1:59-1540(+)